MLKRTQCSLVIIEHLLGKCTIKGVISLGKIFFIHGSKWFTFSLHLIQSLNEIIKKNHDSPDRGSERLLGKAKNFIVSQ